MTRLALAALFSLGLSQALKLPADWQHCKTGPGFTECMKKAVEVAVKSMAPEGLPAFGVLPLDPMHFDELVIDQATGPVAVKLTFKNMDVTGIKALEIEDLKGDWNRLDVNTHIPVPLSLYGDYSIEGKVLTLPIIGNGFCNLTFQDFRWSPISLIFKEENTKGKRHIKVDHIELQPTTSHLHMEFQNLFNGDKLLGQQMNLFLNENWREIFDELKPAVSKAFGAAYKDVANRILTRVPKDDILS